MLDADRLLGGLLDLGMRRRGVGFHTGGKVALGMGLLGVAMAAFEHYSEKTPSGKQGGKITTGKGRPTAVPRIERPVTPPPPPAAPVALSGGLPAAPPVPPAAPAAHAKRVSDPVTTENQADALLYLRAMIAAAAADGEIDDQERHYIIGKLEESGLSEDERQFLLSEMEWPMGSDELVAATRDRQQAMRLYITSLLAIEVDTEAEREYLRRLGTQLEIPAEILDSIHRRFHVTL